MNEKSTLNIDAIWFYFYSTWGGSKHVMNRQSWRSEFIDIMDGMQRGTNTSQQSTIYLAVTSDMYNEVKHDRRQGGW